MSGATVSRVLNDVGVSIAPETRLRVLRIASEMGYQPNRAAQALVTGRTQTLALWVANLHSPYYARVIYHTRKETIRHDYDLMITGTQMRADNTLDTSRLLSWPVDGVLAVDLPTAGEIPGLEKSLLWGKPLVDLGAYVIKAADFVFVDFRDTVIEAVQHLDSVGCQRIAYLVPHWFEWFREIHDARLLGYETAMAQLGREPEYIITTDGTRKAVVPVLKDYVERQGCPDGLFCFNDDMAVGAFRALRDLGLRIPEDVALIGCDGIEETAYYDPPLTTLVQPLEEMCALAWTFLERRICEHSLPLQQVTLQPRLEVRGSSLR